MRNAITSKIRPFCGEYVTKTATPSRAITVLSSEEARAYKPYQQYIFDGKYPLFRQIYMITTGASGSLAGGFYSFVTGNIGQKIILKTGILPARMQRIQVELGE